MKNEEIVKAWDGALPGEETGERMLAEIKEKSEIKRKPAIRKALLPLAAALAVAVAVGSVAYTMSRTAKRTYAVELPENGRIVFAEGEAPTASSLHWDAPTVGRALTDAELSAFLPRLAGNESDELYGVFDEKTGALIHAEGSLHGVKACFSTPGNAPTDAVAEPASGARGIGVRIEAGEPGTGEVGVRIELDENGSISVAYGVPVRAGVFVTDKNSRGERTAVLSVSGSTAGGEVYLETASDVPDAQYAANILGHLMASIVKGGGPVFGAVAY